MEEVLFRLATGRRPTFFQDSGWLWMVSPARNVGHLNGHLCLSNMNSYPKYEQLATAKRQQHQPEEKLTSNEFIHESL